MLDTQDSYVILTFSGPFGEITQNSVLMRLSEAAMTAASFRTIESLPGQVVPLVKVEVVQIRDEDNKVVPIKG